MSTRFDLEQEILECWKVTGDITLFAKKPASEQDWQALSTYYEYKFNQLWETFEGLIKTQDV